MTLERNGALMGERLTYDRIGRLRVVTTFENVANTWTPDATAGWSSSYMYDQNSNLTRVKRSEALSATPTLYDDVTITPQDLTANTSNVIDVVTDAGSNAVAGFTDLRTQTTAQTAVDQTGRVTTESVTGNARTNTWTSTDALSTATAGTTTASYLYDAAGNVVRVIVDNAGTDSTIYRIPSGGIADVATYKRIGNGSVVPMEWTIVGNGVIGVSRDVEDPETGQTFHRRVGTKFYPLTDHLGSVRAVVGDVKLPASGGTFTADVMSVYDYEAYGVPRPGRNLDVRAYWRYGFQGMLKQSELSGSTTDVLECREMRSVMRQSRVMRSVPCKRPVQTSREAQEMAGNPAMMVDPWGLDGTGLTVVTSLATPLKPGTTSILGVPFFGSLPPTMPWVSNSMIQINLPKSNEVHTPIHPWGGNQNRPSISAQFGVTYNLENMYGPLYSDVKNLFMIERGLSQNDETGKLEPDPDFPEPEEVTHNLEARSRKWTLKKNLYYEKRVYLVYHVVVKAPMNRPDPTGFLDIMDQIVGFTKILMLNELKRQILLASDALTVVQEAAKKGHPGMSEYYRKDVEGQAILANYILTGTTPSGEFWEPGDLRYLRRLGDDLRANANNYLPHSRRKK